MTKQEAFTEKDMDFGLIFNKVKQARAAITDKHGTKKPTENINSSIPCPCCEKGLLRYTISSYNGHIHAACDSGSCVQWME